MRQAMDPDGAMAAALAMVAAGFGHRREAVAAAVAGRLAQAVAFRPEGWARVDRVALGQDATGLAALAAALRVVAGAVHPAPAVAVARLLGRGHGTLAGAVLTRGGVLAREPAALGPPVPARRGAVWDGRWHLGGEAPQGALFGAGGEGPGLPAVVRAGLPAVVLNGAVLPPAMLSFRPAGGAAG